ncbi:ParB/RepB/Spo0J family partition protein [Cellulomonas sp. 179-A 4D5 NHS]|uniref:ParB/RepB/Spo0J family partition protein n=1 Tax=Cellulomonas sp. 179-A 4D5 NHS TaxID=3142378 RepID=UPI0039A19E87
MTTTDTTTTAGQIVEVDPRTLILEVNVRRDADLDAEFLASIRDLGVLTPVLVQRREDGLHVRAGQRRTLAAVETGRATIPAHVVDADTDETHRIVEQLAENDHRRALRDGDHLAAFEQLALLGLTAEQIAKRTGTKKDRVTSALTVAASPVAAAATAQYDLTLDQAAVIAEFADDADAVERLTTMAAEDPRAFVHCAQKMRDDRTRAQAVAVLTADLTERGLRVISEPYYDDRKIKALAVLAAADDTGRTPLTDEAHATCPGHVVWINHGYRGVQAVPGCEGWRAHGHVDRHSTATGARGGRMTEEEKAERRVLIANNKAWPSAQTVRRDWLTTFATRKTAPKDAPAFIAAALARRTSPDTDDLRLARTLLGIPERANWSDPDPLAEAIAKASPARAQHIALVLILATIEQRTGIHTWRRPSPESRAYFTALDAWGYGLSDVEHLVLAEQPTPAAAPERTAPDDAEHDLDEDEDGAGEYDDVDEPDDAA